MPLADCS